MIWMTIVSGWIFVDCLNTLDDFHDTDNGKTTIGNNVTIKENTENFDILTEPLALGLISLNFIVHMCNGHFT